MKIQSIDLNSLWGELLVEEFIRNGVVYFCISPGSRSTPLTIAAARHKLSSTSVWYDERGASFHALGYAKATGKPAVLICTSGTAAANYFPAIIEAAMDNVPMIILTADRPPELRQTGANQTINQTNLYGNYVKWYFELPCPDKKIPPQMLLTTVDQLVYQSCNVPGGPVHLNCMFREPLTPASDKPTLYHASALDKWTSSEEPLTKYSAMVAAPNQSAIEQIAEILNKTKSGILSIGKLTNRKEMRAIVKFAQILGWPLFPDITSGLRLGEQSDCQVHYFDQLILSSKFCNNLKPDTVMHLGGKMVSQRWTQLLKRKSPKNYILAQNHPYRQDENHIVSRRIECDLTGFLETISDMIDQRRPSTEKIDFVNKSRLVHQILADKLLLNKQVSEISTAFFISTHLPQYYGLFLGSSMPVRDMDMYATCNGNPVRVGANRGASGIDGAIASAIGFLTGLKKPVTVVLGDLALLHDINSLALINTLELPLTIIVINNRGGGIFSFLPVSKTKDVFEPFFGTPHKFKFKYAAEMFGLKYFTPLTNAELVEGYKKALSENMSTIIEISTDRIENKSFHLKLQKQIVSKIDNSL